MRKPFYENSKIIVERWKGDIEYRGPNRICPDVVIFVTPLNSKVLMSDSYSWYHCATLDEAKQKAEEIIGKSNTYEYKI